MFKLRNNDVRHFLDASLSLKDNLSLIDEQIRIERIGFLLEISELRKLLKEVNPDGDTDVCSWAQRADEIYERLFFYQQGYCSRVKLNHHLFMPYSYRRTIRTLFS